MKLFLETNDGVLIEVAEDIEDFNFTKPMAIAWLADQVTEAVKNASED